MKRVFLLLLLWGAWLMPAFAQNYYPITDRPTIQVSGEGTIPVEPDRARLFMSVSAIRDTVTQAKQVVDQQVMEIQKMLLSMGVDEKSINASRLNVHRVEDRDPEPRDPSPAAAGGRGKPRERYAVSRQVTVTVMAIDKLDEILDRSVPLGTNEIWNVELFASRQEELKREALRLAVADARAAADLIAAESGRSVVSMFMTEHEFGGGGGGIMYAEAAMDARGGQRFARGTVRILARVNVVYEVK